MRLARPQVKHLAANNYRMDAYILSQTFYAKFLAELDAA
jgi:hypothetical protein